MNDLVTDTSERSKEFGGKLLGFVEHWAREHDCQVIALSSRVQRFDAHRFYIDKMDYDKTSYVYKKQL